MYYPFKYLYTGQLFVIIFDKYLNGVIHTYYEVYTVLIVCVGLSIRGIYPPSFEF